MKGRSHMLCAPARTCTARPSKNPQASASFNRTLLAFARTLLPALLLAARSPAQSTNCPPPPPPRDFSGQSACRVLQVSGPDTFVAELDGQPSQVRLLGIYVPADKSAADAAVEFLDRLLTGESVYLEFDPGWPQRDPQGRCWAYVYRSPDGLPVNLELVRQGYARVAAGEDFQQCELLTAYERLARQNRNGLWAIAAAHRTSGSAASRPATGAAVPSADDNSKVYVTPHGRKYHRQDCPHARRGATALSLEEAKRRGYTPCSRCRPPQ